LTDNGREYCGREDHHPFELFLQLEDIEHRTTKVRRPQSKGFVERLYRTLLDEHFRIEGREKYYESLAEMQEDLGERLKYYNNKRAHRGRNMKGEPLFKDSLKRLKWKKTADQPFKLVRVILHLTSPSGSL